MLNVPITLPKNVEDADGFDDWDIIQNDGQITDGQDDAGFEWLAFNPAAGALPSENGRGINIDATSVPDAAGVTATISITGVRLTQGNAVDCPQVRDDAGVVHVVSYLSPAVAIGARVSLSGFYGITTTCLGTVLVVQTESLSEN